MKRRTWFKLIALSAAPLLLVTAELVVRGAYGRALFFERYQPGYVMEKHGVLDEQLFRRFRPGIEVNFNLLYPRVDCPIIINQQGLRGPEVEVDKNVGAFRIACLGDSCTFGWRVQEDDVYPRQLEQRLRELHPSSELEVLNFGSPGYTTHQGAVLMRERVPSFSPDVVVVAYGYNDFTAVDATIDQQAESYRAYFERNPPLQRTINSVLSESALYRYLRYQLGLKVHDTPGTASDGTKVWQVGPRRYGELLEEIVARAQQSGAQVVLVNSDLPNPRALRVLRPFAAERGLPLVDLRALFLAQCGGGLAGDAPDLGSEEPPPSNIEGKCRIRFRVYAPSKPAQLHLHGDGLNDGAMANAVTAMRDDGENGDQRPGDGVYSCLIEVEPTQQLAFTFRASPPPPNLAGFDSHFFHSIDVPADRASMETPIYRFGNPMTRLLVVHDWIHPNAEGQRIWADAVREMVKRTAKYRAFAR